MKHKRNVEGLKDSARFRHQKALERASEAIRLLTEQGRPVNFNTVSQSAGVSTAWLYRETSVRARIEHLRQRQTPHVTVPAMERPSNASKDALIETLQLRVKRQQEEIRELKRQLEVAYGMLYQAGVESDKNGNSYPVDKGKAMT